MVYKENARQQLWWSLLQVNNVFSLAEGHEFLNKTLLDLDCDFMNIHACEREKTCLRKD